MARGYKFSILFLLLCFCWAVIHWPVAFHPGANLNPKGSDGQAHLDDVALADTWRALIRLRDTGKVKTIGVSNFTPAMIDGIVAATGVVPVVNQVEAHPYLQQPWRDPASERVCEKVSALCHN